MGREKIQLLNNIRNWLIVLVTIGAVFLIGCLILFVMIAANYGSVSVILTRLQSISTQTDTMISNPATGRIVTNVALVSDILPSLKSNLVQFMANPAIGNFASTLQNTTRMIQQAGSLMDVLYDSNPMETLQFVKDQHLLEYIARVLSASIAMLNHLDSFNTNGTMVSASLSEGMELIATLRRLTTEIQKTGIVVKL